MLRRNKPYGFFALAVISIASLGTQAAPQYSVQLISEDSISPGFAISESGRVVGYTTSLTGYIWNSNDQSMTLIKDQISIFPYWSGGLYFNPNKLDINDSGVVVGVGITAESQASPAIWDADNGVQFLNGNFGAALAINSSGQVVGWSFGTGYNNYGPFLWSAETGMQNLSGFAGSVVRAGAAFDVNDTAEIVGECTGLPCQDSTSAFFWSSTAGFSVIPPLNESEAYAYGMAINNERQVVGFSFYGNGLGRIYLWTNDGSLPQDLDAPVGLPEFADINDSGEIVATIIQEGGRVGYIYDGEAWYKLDDVIPSQTGVSLAYARAINNAGQITGETTIGDGYVLTPTNTAENHAPVLAGIGNKSISELSTLTFAATASDSDVGDSLTFSLGAGAPSGASISSAGEFTWTPSEPAGPGNHAVTVAVTDDGDPTLSDSETINIQVGEVNSAPALSAIPNFGMRVGATLTFTANAMDPDVPSNSLVFSLGSGAPQGATIHPSTGVFSWTPTNKQGPSGRGPDVQYTITVLVTDNGNPALTASRTFVVSVDKKKG